MNNLNNNQKSESFDVDENAVYRPAGNMEIQRRIDMSVQGNGFLNFPTKMLKEAKEKNISLEAQVLFMHLITKPPYWQYTRGSGMRDTGFTEYKYNKAIKDLKDNGYVKIKRQHIDGRFYPKYIVSVNGDLND